jgi:hypothetical protein
MLVIQSLDRRRLPGGSGSKIAFVYREKIFGAVKHFQRNCEFTLGLAVQHVIHETRKPGHLGYEGYALRILVWRSSNLRGQKLGGERPQHDEQRKIAANRISAKKGPR